MEQSISSNSQKTHVLTFGEILFRMSPRLSYQWLHNTQTSLFIGGAELNVARALACWKQPVSYVTRMPEHILSSEIHAFLSAEGIDTSKILWGGDRIGMYILPQGTDLKNASVIYDRAHSSFAEMNLQSLQWDELLSDVTWLHISAISPALNQEIADICLQLVQEAHNRGITISLDLNYRAKLWQYGVSPPRIMTAIASYCNLIMGNIWAAHALLDIPIAPQIALNQATKEEYIAQADRTAQAIQNQFPRCQTVANTFRFDSPKGGISYFSTLHNFSETHVSKEIHVEKVIDRVGSGDCFMAGLIYGHLRGWHKQKIVDFSACAATGKLKQMGDATTQTVSEILQSITDSNE